MCIGACVCVGGGGGGGGGNNEIRLFQNFSSKHQSCAPVVCLCPRVQCPPASTGYVCEEHDNPADYFLDVINRCEVAAGHGKTAQGKVFIVWSDKARIG